MNLKAIYAVPAAAALLLTACNHKELCFDHPEHALSYRACVSAVYEQEWQYTYPGGTDWQAVWPAAFGTGYDALRPALPSGLRIVDYSDDGSYAYDNLPPEGGCVNFAGGTHSLLFYNNDTEYIVFDGLSSFATARATTRTRSRASYAGNTLTGSRNETTVNPPDMLYGNYVEVFTPIKDTEAQPLPVTMRPLVFSYLVRYEFSSGLQYVAMARGALAGMAESVYLNSGQTSAGEATILYDCTVEQFGAQAIVRSFGVPDYPNPNYSRSTRKYGLNLEVRLTNGSAMTFDFDVTDQVAAQPRGGVIVVSGIVVPDDKGQSGSSGFDVDINDWGEYEDIDLPL